MANRNYFRDAWHKTLLEAGKFHKPRHPLFYKNHVMIVQFCQYSLFKLVKSHHHYL